VAEDGSPTEAESPDLESRRSFVKKLGIGAVAGTIGVAVAVPAFKYLAGTGLEADPRQEWLRIADAGSVPVGEPTLFKASVERKAGWITTTTDISAYVTTLDGENFTALSNICTHLGCRVRWVGDQDSFFCPCHNAVFASDGSVVSGPPPAPLQRFDVMVEDGELMIKEV
jgi:Rieske Fe-S protein